MRALRFVVDSKLDTHNNESDVKINDSVAGFE